LGPLAGEFPLLSLRTNKADVAVGVPKDVAEKLDAAGEKWRVDGRFVSPLSLPVNAQCADDKIAADTPSSLSFLRAPKPSRIE
jgi:hypothetical protein